MLKLAVFDLDGTLKQTPDPYVYLHRCLGTMDEADKFFAQGMAGDRPEEMALYRGGICSNWPFLTLMGR